MTIHGTPYLGKMTSWNILFECIASAARQGRATHFETLSTAIKMYSQPSDLGNGPMKLIPMTSKMSIWRFKVNGIESLPYPVFMPKPSTHRMHDPGSIVPHIRPKVITDNQMSRVKYYHYISSVSKDYDDSQWNGTMKDPITPHERQPGQHVA
jgi:hypothetical protein